MPHCNLSKQFLVLIRFYKSKNFKLPWIQAKICFSPSSFRNQLDKNYPLSIKYSKVLNLGGTYHLKTGNGGRISNRE